MATGKKKKPAKKVLRPEITGVGPNRRLFYLLDYYGDASEYLECQYADSFREAAIAWIPDEFFFLFPLFGTGTWGGDWCRELIPPSPDVKPVALAYTQKKRQLEIGLATWPQHCPPTLDRFWQCLSEEQRAMRERQWILMRANLPAKESP